MSMNQSIVSRLVNHVSLATPRLSRFHRLAARTMAIGCFPILLAAGCSGSFNPWSKVAKVGVQLVGDAIQEADVDEHAKVLIGQPLTKADAEFGQRIEDYADTNSPRHILTYPVKGDVLDDYRWIVEAENDQIVALSKAKFDPDGGKDLIKKAFLREKAEGKSPQELQEHSTFEKLVLTLRRKSTGHLVRVYDTSKVTDLLGSKYCVLEFDANDRCTDLRLVGVPASTKKDPAS